MESLQKFRKLFLELLHDAGFHSAASGNVRASVLTTPYSTSVSLHTPLYRYVISGSTFIRYK